MHAHCTHISTPKKKNTPRDTWVVPAAPHPGNSTLFPSPEKFLGTNSSSATAAKGSRETMVITAAAAAAALTAAAARPWTRREAGRLRRPRRRRRQPGREADIEGWDGSS